MTSNLKIDTLLNHIRSGKKPISLVKQLNISPQLLHYYLKGLKDKGIIRKLTKGVWEIVKELPKDDTKGEVRAHAFIWKVKLHKNIRGWDKREEILKAAQIPVTHAGNTIRIEIKGKKVWLCNNSIIIYEPKSFFSCAPIEARKLAIYELLEVLRALESKIGINLGKYKFSVKREHYALIKNELANQVNKEGDKIRVLDNGELWFEIDNSFNLDEAEFYKTKSFSGLTNSTGAQGYFNSQKNTSWKVTPEFVLNVMNGIQQNQLVFDKNMKSHLKVLNKIGNAVDKLTKAIEHKNIKQKEESQKTLGEY